MDRMEKVNRLFGTWYEGLFGGASEDVRPKDVLKKILAALEDHRKEGFDNRVYVPNQYILEIAVHDEEEKSYLLSFLNREELETAIRRYCKQNNYVIRGRLDFTIKETDLSEEPEDSKKRPEKVRVRARYSVAQTESTGQQPFDNASPDATPAPLRAEPFEERTVASAGIRDQNDEAGTVPSIVYASLMVYAPDKSPYRHAITGRELNIGRSRTGNEIVIDSDGQISKRHARLEIGEDGRYVLTDLASTNGTRVNGKRVDVRALNDGDEIVVGSTRIEYKQENKSDAPSNRTSVIAPRGEFGGAAAASSDGGGSSSPAARVLRSRAARLVLLNEEDDSALDDFLLASETRIGRGITNDIVLPDRSLAIHHALIKFDGDSYLLEALPDAPTSWNETPIAADTAVRLEQGDRIRLGALALRFESGTI